MGKVKDMSGQKINHWTIIRCVGRGKNGGAIFECVCDCGTVRIVSGSSIRSGASTCCGCIRPDQTGKNGSNYKHGGRKERLYRVFRGMIDRCENTHDPNYHRYGGRGIKVCDEWRNDYSAFRKWAYENGYIEDAKKYECTIDRIDNDGDYCPQNCRWTNSIVQSNNRSTNRFVEINGECHTLSEWSRLNNIPKDTLLRRINVYHWPLERAIFEPARKKPRKSKQRA